MPKIDNQSDLTKPFTFHGLDLSGRSGDHQRIGNCPFCFREDKFYVNNQTGQWECKTCTESGNIHTFLKRLYEESKKTPCDYEELKKERGYLYIKSLEEWGLCKSVLTGEWMIPGYVIDSVTRKPRIRQLYVYREDVVEKRRRFICRGFQHKDDDFPTNHGLFLARWDARKPKVAIVEGVWDGIALQETMSRTKYDGDADSYVVIGTESASLYADTNIIATPGANIFYESWALPLTGKDVTFFYDNDHPRKHPKNDRMIEGSGILGVKRAVSVLTSGSDLPASIQYIKWGDDGFDPNLPHRYDVRDHLCKSVKTPQDRSQQLGRLLEKITPIPNEWIAGKKQGESNRLSASPIPCTTWKELQDAWKCAMFWNDGLDAALPAMLATAATVFLPEDLIWLKVMSPPSTGKTELAEALALAEDAVVIVSTFTGLHSGMRLEDGEDGSLISRLKGMCLIIKEGDTMLRLPDREKVWAELRDAFDQNSRTHFKNGVANRYLEHPFTQILCGTGSLHEMDDSELGQRYLHITIMEKIDKDQEKAINNFRLSSLFNTLKHSPLVNGKGNSTSEKLHAKQLTAGYLQYLRTNMGGLISAIDSSPEVSEECNAYARFVAYFRARPSRKQLDEATRELSTRLSIQIGKLAYGIAAVLGKNELDREIMERVRKVAIDTASGITLKIAKVLYESENGMDTQMVAANLLMGDKEIRELLKFMYKIDIVERFEMGDTVGIGTRKKWRLTKELSDLYKLVIEGVNNASGKKEGTSRLRSRLTKFPPPE